LECCTCTWYQQTIPVHLKDEKPKLLTEGINKNVFKIILLVIAVYQTRKTVFDDISKHREESQKKNVQQSVFEELCGVW